MDQTLQCQRKLWRQCRAIEASGRSPGGHSIALEVAFVVNFYMSARHVAFDFASLLISPPSSSSLVVVINVRLFLFFDSEPLEGVFLSAHSNTKGVQRYKGGDVRTACKLTDRFSSINEP